MITTNNSQPLNNFGPENSSGIDGKKIDPKQENPEKSSDNQANNTGSNPYQAPDNADINTNNTRESEHPVTVLDFDTENKTAEARLKSKPVYTEDEQKIADFIAKVKDDTFEAIIKSFDQMLINARKMMEENQRYYREKIIPKEEAMKKEMIKEDIQKEVLKEVLG